MAQSESAHIPTNPCAECSPPRQTKENIKVWRKRVTDFLLSQGFVKGYAGCGLRSANVPERRLTLPEMRENLSTGDSSEPGSPLTPSFTVPAPPTTRLARDDPVYYTTTWTSHTPLHIHYTHSDSESNSTPPQQLNDLHVDVMYQDQHQHHHHHQQQQQQQQNPTSSEYSSTHSSSRATSYLLPVVNYSPIKVASPSPYSSPPYTIYNPPSQTALPPLLSPLPSQHSGYVAPGLMSGASMFY